MNNHLTELVFIIDRSGSMHGMEADTIGGFNSMLAKQRAEDGEALVSTVLFHHETLVLHDRIPLDRIEDMTARQYIPSGSTALLDALGGAIHHIGLIHKYARAEDRPRHTLFVIITDGMENASQRYTLPRIQEMILRQKEKYGWEFLFLGANMDAVTTAAAYGISADRAVTYENSPKATRLNYDVISEAVCRIRADEELTADWKAPIAEHANRN